MTKLFACDRCRSTVEDDAEHQDEFHGIVAYSNGDEIFRVEINSAQTASQALLRLIHCPSPPMETGARWLGELYYQSPTEKSIMAKVELFAPPGETI